MKPVLIALLAIVAMGLLGWITFNDSQDKATITIEKKEIQDDTRKAVDKGKDLVDEAKQKLHESERKTVPREFSRPNESSPPEGDRKPALNGAPSAEQPRPEENPTR
jgi:hypothetical protein